MGLLYKGFQRVSYDAMEIAREKGIEVEKQRQKEEREKREKIEMKADWSALDKACRGKW